MNRQYLEELIESKRKAHDRWHWRMDIKAALATMAVVSVMWLAIIGAYMLVVM